MSEDLIKLYSDKILALAAQIPRLGTLDAPDGVGKARSPLCGSTVSVQITLMDGLISDYAQNVKACALGQAAASSIGAEIIGQDRDTLQRGRDELAAMLKNDGPAPTAPWDGLEVLRPAVAYKNRHPSILLTFDAILEAYDAAMGQP